MCACTWIGSRANFAELTGGVIFDEEADRTHPAPVPTVIETRMYQHTTFSKGNTVGKTRQGRQPCRVEHEHHEETGTSRTVSKPVADNNKRWALLPVSVVKTATVVCLRVNSLRTGGWPGRRKAKPLHYFKHFVGSAWRVCRCKNDKQTFCGIYAAVFSILSAFCFEAASESAAFLAV